MAITTDPAAGMLSQRAKSQRSGLQNLRGEDRQQRHGSAKQNREQIQADRAPA